MTALGARAASFFLSDREGLAAGTILVFLTELRSGAFRGELLFATRFLGEVVVCPLTNRSFFFADLSFCLVRDTCMVFCFRCPMSAVSREVREFVRQSGGEHFAPAGCPVVLPAMLKRVCVSTLETGPIDFHTDLVRFALQSFRFVKIV